MTFRTFLLHNGDIADKCNYTPVFLVLRIVEALLGRQTWNVHFQT